MTREQWLAPWTDAAEAPAPEVHHCASRVVDRNLILSDGDRAYFVELMRKYEVFSGCRVLTYCFMPRHYHLLLEVPPWPVGGISDEEWLERLAPIHRAERLQALARALAEARAAGDEEKLRQIFSRLDHRVHDLGQFMKPLLQHFCRWYNRQRSRRGTLWEMRFRSVRATGGVMARAFAAHIDADPARSGLVKDPADFRWCGWGAASGRAPAEEAERARAGLLRVGSGWWSATPGSAAGRRAVAGRWREFEGGYRDLVRSRIDATAPARAPGR